MTKTIPAANPPSIFTFQSSHPIRTAVVNGELFFVAKDVFDTLELPWRGSDSMKTIPQEWRVLRKFRTTQKNQHGTTGEQEKSIICINFKAVCKVAFRSNKPEADAFTNWAAEVIDTVFKTGKYEAPAEQPVEVTKFINLCSHPDFSHGAELVSCKFHFSSCAKHAYWKHLQHVGGGARCTAYPDSRLAAARQAMLNITSRAEQFFRLKDEFERLGMKWLFGGDVELPELPQFPQVGTQARLGS